jgi:putative drug exporter of the RND superfamily
MARFLYRIGGWSARRKRTMVGLWLLVLAAVVIGGLTLSKPTDDGFSIPGTESQQAIDLLDAKFPGTGGASARVVVAAPEGHRLTEKKYADELDTALADVAKAPQVVAVSASRDATLSADKRIGFADITYAVPVDEVSDDAKDALEEIAQPLRDAGLQVEFSGGVVATSAESGHSSEVYGLMIGFVVLAVTFGALVAAGMPLLMALIGVGISLMGIQLLTRFVDLSSTAPTLALMLGLAVGIDYTLFIVSRHRAQLAAGMPLQESIAVATATAGSAVLFAGLTVIIALSALSVVGIPFLTAMGLAAAGAVAISVVLAVTLVPAVLSVLGGRLNAGRLRVPGRRKDTSPDDPEAAAAGSTSPAGERWGRLVTARPWLTIAGVVVLCGLSALPLRSLDLGLPDDHTKATSTTERRAYDLLTDGFGPGFNGPLTLVISTPGATNAAELGAQAQEGLSTAADIAAVSPPVANQAGDVAILTVTPDSAPSSDATKELVKNLREAAADAEELGEVRAYVTGTTAINIDVSQKLSDALPVFLLLIVVLALLLLMLVFRSILVPVKAVAGFLLSLAASLGLTVFVFQQGHLASLFGVQATGPVVSFLPVLLIGILFGLAMDYEVFLVSRIREDYLATDDPHAAITVGMRHSARVVTAAGLIMIAVFGSFIFGDDPIIKSIGFSLAIGVLIDAFLVRMTLVPAVLALLGRRAWSLPGWLDRLLPDMDIEGARLPATSVEVPRTPAVP